MKTANTLTPRLVRLGMLAITGATALSVAACGNSNNATPTQPASATSSTGAQAQPPSSAQTPGPEGKDRVAGLIASVAGDTVQVTEPNGTATVGFTTSTKISELSPAGLQDVTVGSCVGVRPAENSPQSGAPVIAEGVHITQAVDGKCQAPKQPPAGQAPPPGAPPGGPAGGPGGGPAGGPPPGPPVHGTVASVAGDTITVNGADGTPTTVTVTDKTHFSKEATASSQALAAGKCIMAEGSKDSGGALQASEIRLRPASNGTCPAGPPRGGHGHGRGH